MYILDFDSYIKVYKGLLIKTKEDFERNLIKSKAFLLKCFPHLNNIVISDDEEKINFEMCLMELTEYFYNTEFNKGNKNGYDGNTNINFLSASEQKSEKLEIIKTYIPHKYLYVGRRQWRE